jgi:hypothetical protein
MSIRENAGVVKFLGHCSGVVVGFVVHDGLLKKAGGKNSKPPV